MSNPFDDVLILLVGESHFTARVGTVSITTRSQMTDRNIRLATTGAGALARIRDAAFNLVIVEGTLPDMAATDFIRAARALPKTELPKIIATSKNAADRTAAINAGADAFYFMQPIPIDLTRVIAQQVVSHLMERRRWQNPALPGFEDFIP